MKSNQIVDISTKEIANSHLNKTRKKEKRAKTRVIQVAKRISTSFTNQYLSFLFDKLSTNFQYIIIIILKNNLNLYLQNTFNFAKISKSNITIINIIESQYYLLDFYFLIC